MNAPKQARVPLIMCALGVAAAAWAAPLAARAQDAASLVEADAPPPCSKPEDLACLSGKAQGGGASAAENQPLDRWSLAASTGLSARDDGPDGSYQAVSLTRGIGRGYLRAGVMRYHGTLLQADTALPSDYLIGTIAAGGNFDGWVVDGWVSYGRQDYGKISTAAGKRSSTGATQSGYYAVGGDFGRVVTLAPDWYLTPTVAGSFAHGKLLRPAPTGTDIVDLETDEPTWSGTAALRIDHAFGASRSHYAGLYLSRNWTSNAVSQVRLPEGDGTTAPSSLDSKHYADMWFEVGMTANMRLTDDLALDVYATRSFEALAGNTVSAGISLRKSF